MARKAQEKALAYLERLVRSRRRNKEVRLPNYQYLARDAGVSHRTMLKALRELRDRGVLSISHGTGTTVLPKRSPRSAPVPEPAEPERGPKWRRVSRALYRDIAGGGYGSGAVLPSLKELEHRYGATYRCLKRALHDLHSKGLVEPHKRRYRVRRLSSGAPGNTIVLISFAGEERGSLVHRFVSDRSMDHFRALQIACRQASVRLHLVPVYYGPAGLAGLSRINALARSGARRRGATMGFIVWQMNIPPDYLAKILGSVTRSGRPVCLFRETDTEVPAVAAARAPLFRQFSMVATCRCGRAIGDYLVRKGHRGVAYVHPSAMDHDSQRRFDGLAEVVRAAGGECTAHVPAARDAAPLRSGADVGGIINEARKQFFKYENRQVRRDYLHDRIELEMLQHIDHYASRRRMRARLVPVLEELAQRTKVTAWVAYNDGTAMECLDFLEHAGKRVPQDIAVVGFDDSQIAVYNRLTSYNFNGDAYMHAMVEHVLRPKQTAGAGQPVAFDGFVVERESA